MTPNDLKVLKLSVLRRCHMLKYHLLSLRYIDMKVLQGQDSISIVAKYIDSHKTCSFRMSFFRCHFFEDVLSKMLGFYFKENMYENIYRK